MENKLQKKNAEAKIKVGDKKFFLKKKKENAAITNNDKASKNNITLIKSA